jgi:hypothetical protein
MWHRLLRRTLQHWRYFEQSNSYQKQILKITKQFEVLNMSYSNVRAAQEN